eukprot:scaffold31479_cov73-Skeletonema_marinoi.AAC.2
MDVGDTILLLQNKSQEAPVSKYSASVSRLLTSAIAVHVHLNLIQPAVTSSFIFFFYFMKMTSQPGKKTMAILTPPAPATMKTISDVFAHHEPPLAHDHKVVQRRTDSMSKEKLTSSQEQEGKQQQYEQEPQTHP